MRRQLRKSKEKGQSLVEYALLLSLVAVVSIVILGVLGLAVTRVYAQVAAALGASRNSAAATSGGYNIAFNGTPQCGYLNSIQQGQQGIGLYAQLTTTNLTDGDIAAGVVTAYSESQREPVGMIAAGGPYKVNRPILTFNGNNPPPDDLSVCPHTLVVQTDKAHGGLTIESPVLIEDYTCYPGPGFPHPSCP